MNLFSPVGFHFFDDGFVNKKLFKAATDIFLTFSLFRCEDFVDLAVMLQKLVDARCVKFQHDVLHSYWSVVIRILSFNVLW